jgi:hypothetical protein
MCFSQECFLIILEKSAARRLQGGKVALMTDEKINWIWGKTDLYLMEATSYPGNSGSPVFFQIGIERGNGFTIGGPTLKLAGVMSGGYNDVQPLRTVSISTNQFITPNLGISGVVPAYELKEILFSKDLEDQRLKQVRKQKDAVLLHRSFLLTVVLKAE